MPRHDPTAPYLYWVDPADADVSDTVDRSRRRGSFVTLQEIMATFDRLPPDVRQALADADHPWAPHWADARLFFNRWSPAHVIARLARADQERRELHELRLVGLKK